MAPSAELPASRLTGPPTTWTRGLRLGAWSRILVATPILFLASWLAQPFKNVFHLKNAKANTAVNWGLAAVIYAVVAAVIVRLLAYAGAGVATRRPVVRRGV